MRILDLANLLEQVFEAPWKQAAFRVPLYRFGRNTCGHTLNGVCLAGPRLPIGKNGAVVPLQTLIHYGLADCMEYFFLRDFLIAHIIKVETFPWGHHHYSLLVFHLSYAPARVNYPTTQAPTYHGLVHERHVHRHIGTK
jgi:hypothetical protein